jgi:hypothetical protein
MKLHREFLHLAAGAAALFILSMSMSGHGAWSQTTRMINRDRSKAKCFLTWINALPTTQ